MTNSADLDQQKPTDLDLHCLQRQNIAGSAGQELNEVSCTLFLDVVSSVKMVMSKLFLENVNVN